VAIRDEFSRVVMRTVLEAPTLNAPVNVRFTKSDPPAVRYDGRIWPVSEEPVHWFTRDSWWETGRSVPTGRRERAMSTGLDGGVPLYRGQNEEYTLKRSRETRLKLFGDAQAMCCSPSGISMTAYGCSRLLSLEPG